MRAFFATAASFFVASSMTPALAAPPPEAVPIHELRSRIFKTKPSASLNNLWKSFEALRGMRYAQARKLATASLKDNRFGDYSHWIIARSHLGEVQETCTIGSIVPCKKATEKASQHLLTIISEFPFSPLTKWVHADLGHSRMLVALAHCGQAKWALCRTGFNEAFQRLVSSGDLGAVKPEFFENYSRACSKSPDDICAAWVHKISSLFPKASTEAKSLVKFAPPGLDKGKPVQNFTRNTKRYNSPNADQTAFDSAFGLFREKKNEEAIEAFRKFIDEFPRSSLRFRVQFWLAQALEREKKGDDAKKIYDSLQADSPLTYYGLLASLSDGKDIGTTIEATIPLGASTDPFLEPQELVRLKRAEALVAAGAGPMAMMELQDIKARDALSSNFLLYLTLLNHEAGNHRGAFNLIGELIQRGYSGAYTTYMLRMIFPSPFMKVIEKQAVETKLDPLLVLSLMKQESAFETGVSSIVGAKGLMQIMPATALEVFPNLLQSELSDTETNIRTGTRYLSKMLTKFNGNIVYALAAYNAGPMAVDRWIKAAPEGLEMLDFIEQIPYKETREYVGAIIRNYYWYSRILTGETPKSLAFFWNNRAPSSENVP